MVRRCEVCGGPAWLEFNGRERNGKEWNLVNKYLCVLHAKEWLRERCRNEKGKKRVLVESE